MTPRKQPARETSRAPQARLPLAEVRREVWQQATELIGSGDLREVSLVAHTAAMRAIRQLSQRVASIDNMKFRSMSENLQTLDGKPCCKLTGQWQERKEKKVDK